MEALPLAFTTGSAWDTTSTVIRPTVGAIVAALLAAFHPTTGTSAA